MTKIKSFKELGSGGDDGINPEIIEHLINEEFTRGKFDDAYSGIREQEPYEPVLFHKRLENNYDSDYYTVSVTQDVIGIECEYSYGGGRSAGLWKYDRKSFDSFAEAYNDMMRVAEGLYRG